MRVRKVSKCKERELEVHTSHGDGVLLWLNKGKEGGGGVEGGGGWSVSVGIASGHHTLSAREGETEE